MTFKQVLNLFGINPLSLRVSSYYLKIKEFINEGYSYDQVKDQYEEIMDQQGTNQSGFYYLEAVRRQLRLKKDSLKKREVMADSVKDILLKLLTN